MITNLQNLPEVYKENNVKKAAVWVYKYQNFAIKSALKYSPDGLTKNTLSLYFSRGNKFIRTGVKDSQYGKLCDYITECMQKHLQPLTPSENEKAKVRKNDFTKAENIPPVARLKMVQRPLTAKIIYGVQFDDTIKIFDSEEIAHGFNKGLEFAGKQAGKVITVEIGEV
ncbi:MAG: hypothetical protein J6S67_20960 [Methanobrevibacter sp.]|nr:hypothetical protein [Methanobrevibacter sp.]